MCYIVDCKTCGKQSWGGCGKHLDGLYARIEQGKHCMCRSWPGVAIASQTAQATARPSGSIPRGNENPTIS
ncbi:hypothetical protein L6164_019974 [Bauhinia variegata]|uniref:Uncharacterized protein n=1 Tax=Bauhinia variegata TaxID=167791 RepID=A0ACB9MUE4_BAUVA|nr:hypothetical protein L6164_019974 [Bauhinia variegata]